MMDLLNKRVSPNVNKAKELVSLGREVHEQNGDAKLKHLEHVVQAGQKKILDDLDAKIEQSKQRNSAENLPRLG